MSNEQVPAPEIAPTVANESASEQAPRVELTQDDLTCIRLMLL